MAGRIDPAGIVECDSMLMFHGTDDIAGNDEHLMCLLAEGQSSALDELMRRHHGRVRVLAYRMLGCWAQAEDVAQESFVRVMRHASSYRPTARFTTWLFRIVVNLSQDQQRRKRREAVLQKLFFLHGNEVSNQATGDDGTAEQVRRAVAELAEFQRTAVILHYYERQSCAQIADITGKTSSAVESALGRAYATLRYKLRNLEGPAGE